MRFATGVVSGLFFLTVLASGGFAFAAQLPEGRKTIVLKGLDGIEHAIGTVTFVPDGEGARISVELDAPEMRDEFLSMRPFRCLPGGKELWCHLIYPYETKRRITARDLVDLEYALLFLFKPAGGYGIDAWNGLYFKLSIDGSSNISGVVHEVNLDVLGVPPVDRLARVVTHRDLVEVEPRAHHFHALEIR